MLQQVFSLMAILRRTTRNGQPGYIVTVAARKGYERFVPDKYKHHQRPRPRNY